MKYLLPLFLIILSSCGLEARRVKLISRWSFKDLPVTMYLSDAFSEEDILSAQRAANKWNEALGFEAVIISDDFIPNIETLNRASLTRDNIFGIYKQNDWGDIYSLELAECDIKGGGRSPYINSGDIHFNFSSYEFVSGDSRGSGVFDFESVLLHEMGHFLGLGHSDDPKDAMFYEAWPSMVKRTLGSGDIDNILYLYSK